MLKRPVFFAVSLALVSTAAQAQFNISLPKIQIGNEKPADAAADSGEPLDKQCRDHLRRTGTALKAYDSYHRQQELDAVKEHLGNAQRCADNPLLGTSPNKAAILEELAEKKKLVAAAEVDLVQIIESRAINEEGASFETSLTADTRAALLPKIEAWRARAAAARQKGNKHVDIEWTDKKIAERLAWLADQQVKGAATAVVDRLRAGAIMKRLPALTSKDAFDITRLTAVFQQMDAADLVVVTEEVQLDGGVAWYEPGPLPTKPNYAATEEVVTRGGFIGLNRYGTGESVRQFDVRPAPLPVGTPGFIWRTHGEHGVVFVTLDGGRYYLPITALKQATAPVQLPAKLAHDALSQDAIRGLVEEGALDAKALAAVEKAQEAAIACSDRVWKSTTGEFNAINNANITESTRKNRMATLNDKTWKKAKSTCAGAVATYKKAWLKVVDGRAKEREALLKTSQAKFAAK